MDSLISLFENCSVGNNFQVGSSHWVDVTHVIDPGNFFVRPTICRQYLDTLQAYNEHLSEADLYLGAIVVYKSRFMREYIRGKIYFIHQGTETRCDILALDNGFYEQSVSLRRIRKPLHNLDVPPLAMRCELDLCFPLNSETWTQEATDTMNYFLGTERAKMVIKKVVPDLLTVVLYNSLPDDMATLLMYSGCASWFGSIPNGNEVNRFVNIKPTKLTFTFRKLEIGNTLHVRVLCGETLNTFYVAEVDDYKRYLRLRSDFTEFCKLENVIQPQDVKEGLPVGVFQTQYSKYERAIVKQITVPYEKAIVRLVDVGKDVEVNFLHMKLIDRQFYLVHPAIAIHCMTDEKQIWPNGLGRFLYVGYEFLIRVRSLGESSDMPAFVDVLPVAT